MKKCQKCREVKAYSSFAGDCWRADGFSNICRSCKKERNAEYYQRNKEELIRKQRDRVRENRKKLYQYLIEHPCADCGEQDPAVLTFDHIDPKTKECTVSWSSFNQSWEETMKEIEKCVVRCFNCHMAKTAKDNGWYTFMNEEGNEQK